MSSRRTSKRHFPFICRATRAGSNTASATLPQQYYYVRSGRAKRMLGRDAMSGLERVA